MPISASCCSFHRLFTSPGGNVFRFQALLSRRYVSHRMQCVQRPVLLATPAIYPPPVRLRLAADRGVVDSRQRAQPYASTTVEPLLSPQVKIKTFDYSGTYTSSELKKSELAALYRLHLRDLRFSTLTSLLIRENCVVVRLQHIKAIVTSTSVTLMDTGHPVIKEFVPELQQRLAGITSEKTVEESLPYEFVVLDAMLTKMFTALEERCESLHLTITETLNGLLDHRLFSIDRGQLHILLQLSKDLSEFHALLLDLQSTLSELMDLDEDMAEMYLTHKDNTGESRDAEDIEEIENLLESYYMQSEDMLRQTQQLTHLIEQSESVILINLDSQRNVMLRMSLQLEMGTFAAAMCGLIGVAFGMNLDSSLEENPYAFWLVTGFIYVSTGLLWSRLLAFLGRNLERASLFGSYSGAVGSKGSSLGIGQRLKVKRALKTSRPAS